MSLFYLFPQGNAGKFGKTQRDKALSILNFNHTKISINQTKFTGKNEPSSTRNSKYSDSEELKLRTDRGLIFCLFYVLLQIMFLIQQISNKFSSRVTKYSSSWAFRSM